MKTRKKTNQIKHATRCRASAKRSAKEVKDRVRLGKPPYAGDDQCGAEHLGYVCRRLAGHGGVHEGSRPDRRFLRRWKQNKTEC
jgi:hypothetical protein